MAQHAVSTERLLFVEDEEHVAAPIKRGLEEEGYTVDWMQRAEDAHAEALVTSYAVLIVDWRLPGMDGRTLIEQLREAGCGTPVLMLTALRDVDHRVAGLDAGADDYLTKPFSFEELLARLRALRRRGEPDDAAVDTPPVHLQAGALSLDTTRRKVRYGTEALDLRPKAFRLLELLLRRQGEVVTRTRIAERVWGSPYRVTDNAIDVTVSNLRRALDAAAPSGTELNPVVLETERGVGYRLAVSASSPRSSEDPQ